jgi:hypothetical protein
MPMLANEGDAACWLWRLSEEYFKGKLAQLLQIEWEPPFIVL